MIVGKRNQNNRPHQTEHKKDAEKRQAKEGSQEAGQKQARVVNQEGQASNQFRGHLNFRSKKSDS